MICSGVSEPLRKEDFCRVLCFRGIFCGKDVRSAPELVLDGVLVVDSPKRESCVIRFFIGLAHCVTPLGLLLCAYCTVS